VGVGEQKTFRRNGANHVSATEHLKALCEARGRELQFCAVAVGGENPAWLERLSALAVLHGAVGRFFHAASLSGGDDPGVGGEAEEVKVKEEPAVKQ
jgi:hypothetical protein